MIYSNGDFERFYILYKVEAVDRGETMQFISPEIRYLKDVYTKG